MDEGLHSPAEETARAARSDTPLPPYLAGGGQAGALIAGIDWSQSPLGPREDWPSAMKQTLQLCLESRFPLALAWGPGRVLLYNDAFFEICGAKHPRALGQDFRECWSSAWSAFGPGFERARRGDTCHVEDLRLFLDRNGQPEEAFLTCSFSPVRDDEGAVLGVLHSVVDTTRKVLAARRARVRSELVAATAAATNVREAFANAAYVLGTAPLDVPFSLIYRVESSGVEAELLEWTPSAPEPCRLQKLDWRGSATPAWPIADVVARNRSEILTGLETRFGEWTAALDAEPPTMALLLPITPAGSVSPVAVLIAATSPRLVLDHEYRAFFDQLLAALTTHIGSARAHEELRRRAEQLSALDRAKTAFFSNVSHEFRTPLTLLSGPLEDELAERDEPLPPARRERLVTAHRNTLRLIKLVNSLLDFSRLEAGRSVARYQPTHLATLTSELASMFRSAIERVGLTLEVEMDPLPEPIFVDREMWEKIVLNLISNAFKYTVEGRIQVRLRALHEAVELDVTDTGVGIAAHELPLLFERFHRVPGVQSRTHEGSGIGLSLVRELSRLHGGDVRVSSELGRGTTFTVAIPRGSAHLPAEQIDADASGGRAGAGVAVYVQEALQWSRSQLMAAPAPPAAPGPDVDGAGHARRAKILLADDNADMRDYVAGLLERTYDVVAVPDGEAALALVPSLSPDLILTDVMMPRLDGIGLLRALRADPRTSQLPIILLSARAGDEAEVGSGEHGPDDYLVKPFSARELIARVHTHVELARARRKWVEHLEQSNQELEAFSYSVSHDLRTPLRAIDGFSNAILTRKGHQLDDEGKRYLTRVRKAAERMGELIDELLRLSRISRSALVRRAVPLTALALEVAEELRERQPTRHVDFEAEPGLVANGDARLLQILLENLLENSWKFTARRSDAHVRFGQVATAETPTYFVMDNGAGFDQAYAHRLFQPFQRLHLERDFAGTGIGLAIVHRIVVRHGGRIWAEGSEDKGAVFYFTLTGKT